jgi:predicted DNA-binding transcriptional regulator YafY
MTTNTPKRPVLKSLQKDRKDDILDYLKRNQSIQVNNYDKLDTISSAKMLEDSLKYLEIEESLLVKEKKGRANVWSLKENVLLDAISQKDAINLDYALHLSCQEYSPEVQKTVQKILASNDDTITGHLATFEELRDEKIVKNFDLLKGAIKNREYLKLDILYSSPFQFHDVKPIRLVFLDNNWYLAFEYNDQENGKQIFRLGRVAFINRINFLKENRYSGKNTFQKRDIQKYIDWLDKDIQNSMTFYGSKVKTATLKAKKNIAQYFKQGMKKFLSSQTFQEELEDGSVRFTLTYTNELEIMPFIQKWLPDLIILEPQELKEHYKQKLQQTLDNLD